MCSGLFSSSANGARASRASAYRGLSTSTSTDRSDWTMNGLVGSKLGTAFGIGAGAPAGVFFGGMLTVGYERARQIRAERLMLPAGSVQGQAEVPRCSVWVVSFGPR